MNHWDIDGMMNDMDRLESKIEQLRESLREMIMIIEDNLEIPPYGPMLTQFMDAKEIAWPDGDRS